jgi:hypothetical protein
MLSGGTDILPVQGAKAIRFFVNDLQSEQDPQASPACNILYRLAPSRDWSQRWSCRSTPDEPDVGEITNKWPDPKLPVKTVAQGQPSATEPITGDPLPTNAPESTGPVR